MSLSEEELTDLWEEIDNDSARGMDNSDYPGEDMETVPYGSSHSKRSRQAKREYDENN